jgi:uncharacterized protein (DUF58 family)
MIKPTWRTVSLFLLSLPIALFAVISDEGLWGFSLGAIAIIILLILLDAFLAFSPARLAVTASAPEKIFIGEHGVVTLNVGQANNQQPVHFQMILEQRGDVEPPNPDIVTLPPHEKASITLPIIPKRRGRIWVDRVWTRWLGPMGFVEFSKILSVDRVIDVIPNVRGVHKTAIQFLTNETIFGEKVQQKGEGTEFEALREYRSGDDIRFIDWKHSARHNKLLSKEFRTERNHQIIMGFDTGHLMVEPLGGMPRLDHCINAALRLAYISLRSGDLVGTFGFDADIRQYVQPLRGTPAFTRIQRATAELNYNYHETNFTLGLAELKARLKRRALVILFTDFVDTITAELLIESLQRIANKHVVVFVTLRDSFLQQKVDNAPEQFLDVARAVVAHDFLHDRSVVFERLARCGVHCLDVPSSNLPVSLINRYLEIKHRGLI